MIIVMMVMNDDDCGDYDGHLLGVVGGCQCNVKMISGPLLPSDCKRLFFQSFYFRYLLFCYSKIDNGPFSMSQCSDVVFCCWWTKVFFFSRQID